MANNHDISTLFEQHSFEEIESIKDNLAEEIKKKTNQLKTIVREKYKDIVEASDAIQSMKVNLKNVEQSIWSLNDSIDVFYSNINSKDLETKFVKITSEPGDLESDRHHHDVAQLYDKYHEIWTNFESGNLMESLKAFEDCDTMVEERQEKYPEEALELKNSLARSKQMIQNYICCLIQEAPPDKIGIVGRAAITDRNLFELSLRSIMEFLSKQLDDRLSDNSPESQIRRFQKHSYFNRQLNKLDDDSIDCSGVPVSSSTHIAIPKFISPELSDFLYQSCMCINTIAGYNLDRVSIGISLELILREAFKAYEKLANQNEVTSYGNRHMQFYYDVLYLRMLLSHSKNIQVIEKLDTDIDQLATKFERLLDPIEFFMISESIHDNVVKSHQSTVRLYALLINN